MKKHAFIITGYQDFEWIRESVTHYITYVDCYIHIDRKVKIPIDFIQWAQSTEGVYLYSKYKINWGSYKHLSAILYMLKMAIRNQYNFYHVLSANTMIVKPLEEVLAFFEETPEKNYLEFNRLPEGEENIIAPWYIYYHFLHIYDKRTNLGNQFDWYFCKIQKKLGIKRKLEFKYKGLVYAHLTHDCLKYILHYLKKNPKFFNSLRTCNIGEEFFFQNIIATSPFKEYVINDNKIYTKWTEGGVAKFLIEKDLDEILKSNCLFARKYNEKSRELIRRLDVYK